MKTERLRIENGQFEQSGLGERSGLYLHLMAGEILGVFFDHIHDKENLIQLLQGDAPLSYGRMYLHEHFVMDKHTIPAQVHVINKKGALINSLSICENVYYAQLPPSFFSIGIYEEMLQDLMDQYNVQINLRRPVKGLSHRETIELELLKAVAMKKRIVVLADITSFLSPTELNQVQPLIRKMQGHGYSFLVSESFWNMIFRMCDHVAVVRGGGTVGIFAPEELDDASIRQLLWRRSGTPSAAGAAGENGAQSVSAQPGIVFHGISAGVLRNVSFSVPKGGLQSIQCLDGQSYQDMIALLSGALPLKSGSIQIGPKLVSKQMPQEVKHSGLGIMEDHPHSRMVLWHMTAFDNIAFSLSSKVPFLWLRRKLQHSLRQEMASLCGEDLWDSTLRTLSLMQLQKLAYCKWILYRPHAMVCLDPFTGMDSQIDQVTEQMIQEMLRRDIAVLIVSTYLPTSGLTGKTGYLWDGEFTKT